MQHESSRKVQTMSEEMSYLNLNYWTFGLIIFRMRSSGELYQKCCAFVKVDQGKFKVDIHIEESKTNKSKIFIFIAFTISALMFRIIYFLLRKCTCKMINFRLSLSSSLRLETVWSLFNFQSKIENGNGQIHNLG